MASTYFSIYSKIKKDIEDKVYKTSEMIPSERMLMKMFDVSRNTVRNALVLLEKDGLIYKVHGKGNFVSKHVIVQNLNTFYSFHDKIESLGKKPSSKVLDYDIISADENLAEIFKQPLNSKILYFKRLRLIDNVPVMVEFTYMPESRFVGFDFDELNTVPLYKIFKNKYGVKMQKAVENFKPIKISCTEEGKYLGIPKGSVAMQIIRTSFEQEKVVEYTISHVKPDVFEYSVVLVK